MAIKTPLSLLDINQILSHYGLGIFIGSEPVSQGTVQTNYFVDTTQGKYLLKYYENRAQESVLFECDLLTFLKKHQYPCQAPMPDAQGTFVGTHHGKPYVVFEFISGQPVEHFEDYHKQQIIQQAARLQNLTQTYQPRYREYRWNYTIERCQMLARTAAEKLNTENAYEKLAWVEHESSALNIPKTVPRGICHCDFHFSNILFQDDQLVGLLDFDDANFTYLVFDLVSLIDSWAWPFTTDALDLGHAREIAQAYNQFRPLCDAEVEHIFDVHKLSILFDCVWFFGRGQADDFYEKRKMAYLNRLGRKKYSEALFSS